MGRVLREGTGEVRRAPRRQALKRQPPRGRSRVRACLVESTAGLNRTARTSQRGEFRRWPPRLQPPLRLAQKMRGGVAWGIFSTPFLPGWKKKNGMWGGLSPAPSAACRGRALSPAGAAKVGTRRERGAGKGPLWAQGSRNAVRAKLARELF